jgi:hypothetical protein
MDTPYLIDGFRHNDRASPLGSGSIASFVDPYGALTCRTTAAGGLRTFIEIRLATELRTFRALSK